MKRLNPAAFSDAYTVRGLTPADVPAVLRLMQGNVLYFQYCGGDAVPSEESIRRDMSIVPGNKTLEDKYYVGFFRDETLAAIMDLIDGYPEDNIAFVGFFMMNESMQGTGEGTKIISGLCAKLKALGIRRIRLGIDKGNPQSTHFWKKNGFQVIREVPQETGTILLAERILTGCDETEKRG